MPEFALFANVENPFNDSARALREAVDTILHAEALGFEQVWLTEHHFNPFSVSAALLPLLAYLAARTSRIRLGAGALLLPLHNPVRVAEDLATIDALSAGRLLLGVGRGGPFPEQFRQFGVDPEHSRSQLYEALDLIEQIFQQAPLDYAGQHHQYDQLEVFPRPLRPQLPTWLASLSDDSLQLAARRGYGLMGASAMPVARLREALDAFAAYHPRTGQPLVLARYFLCADQHGAARAQAAPFIRDFGANMRAVLRDYPNAPAMQPFGQPVEAFSEASLLDNAIVGDASACIEHCLALRDVLGPHILLLKPASYDPEVNRRSLTLFAERVRPALD